ncbi:hypothetical protein TIFTF001_003574 [Ficus carica]|uniref:F-box domain-containing protein n=1 Tax=Ficus carica TaxID=3494 RepID=A0AA87Z9R1_FICCA|nr:hypothetical protein TIFTF001_003574 [Ficus carica]
MDRQSTRPTGWADLPNDLLVRILLSLNIVDLVMGAARTCRSWRATSKDAELWETVDLTTSKINLVRVALSPYYMINEESGNRLKLALNAALNLSRGNMTCLIFNFYTYIKGRELISAAQRTPNLKRLVLPAWNQIDMEAFEEAVKYWKDLHSLTIPYIYRSENILSSLGTHCKNFSEMKILSPFHLDFAKAIIAHVPNLKVLSLQCVVVYKDAVLHLLTNMKHLEVLNLTHSVVADFNPQHGPEQNLFFQRVNGEISERAVHLKKFILCTDELCPKCSENTLADHSLIRWYEFGEEHWRQDEVPSLAV